METYEEFGDILKRFRDEAGLSQNGLARASGIDATNINRIEHSKQGPPRKTTIIKLVRGLGFSLSDERAQQLFDLAAQLARPKAMPSTILRSPLGSDAIPRSTRELLPKIRELKRLYLQGLDQIADIEEIIAEDWEDV